MTVTNDFLPFAIGAGANVESQSAYAADPIQSLGNQPGIATSATNNKAIRQANMVTSQLAQFIANTTGTSVNDNGVTAQLLAQLTASLSYLAPVTTSHLSGSGTHYLTQVFFIASGNATSGATYTNNGATFTVSSTISAGTVLTTTGTGVSSISGTLTKATGTGDATITFYAVRVPVALRVRAIGCGGGGGGPPVGAGTGGSAGSSGSSTTFGTSLITVGSGNGGAASGVGGGGGTATLGTGAFGIALNGGDGGSCFGNAVANVSPCGALGASSAFGGAGAGGTSSGGGGQNGIANTGGGGGGGGGNSADYGGSGGGAGGFIDGTVPNPTGIAYSFSWSVSPGGSGGASTSGGGAGGAGGSGAIYITESFQ